MQRATGRRRIKKRRSHVMQTHHKSLVSGRKVLQSVGKSAVYWILSTAGFSSALTAIFVVSLLSFASPPPPRESRRIKTWMSESRRAAKAQIQLTTAEHFCVSQNHLQPRLGACFSLNLTVKTKRMDFFCTVFPTGSSPACCSTIIGSTVPNFHKARDVWISTHFLQMCRKCKTVEEFLLAEFKLRQLILFH